MWFTLQFSSCNQQRNVITYFFLWNRKWNQQCCKVILPSNEFTPTQQSKIFWTIYIFWSCWNQKVIFWFIILLLDLLVHCATGKSGFESHFWHLFFMEINLIIFNSYHIAMTGCMYVYLVGSERLSILLLGYITH